jgi:hypothetical protein
MHRPETGCKVTALNKKIISNMDKVTLLNELKNNAKCQAYLSQFEPQSAQQFLESYVSTKEHLLKWGEDLRNMQHDNNTYFRECAEMYYWQIMQKKLFNLQCLWRAEKIELPVTISQEFIFWEENIKSCPFLDDITESELDAMLTYLENAPYYHEAGNPDSWQAYDDFKDGSNGDGAGDLYPDWYEAYDLFMGTQALIALPDIKGNKEQKYLSAWREHNIRDTKPYDSSKTLFSTEEEMEKFIRNVEPYKILDYFRLYKERNDNSELMETLEHEIELLRSEPGEVIIPEGRFPDAIFQASHLLKVRKMKSLLKEIHTAHLERKEMGISYEQEGTAEEDWLVKDVKNHILEGRRLLGEPEDFDY